jgi:3'(2'), 5'-bisphosphate nucleotidase
LREHFPEDPIVGEEDSKDLRGDAGKALREKVLELTNGVFSESEKLSEDKVRSRLHVLRNHFIPPKLTSLQLLEAIDRGNYAGGATGRKFLNIHMGL